MLATLPFIKDLDRYYPNIEDWYVNKVIPGMIQGSDGMVIAKDGDTPIGVGLYKSEPYEKKLRCIRVLPPYKGRGVGLHLIDRTLKKLDCAKPTVSVAEELIHEYSRIFVNRYDFKISHVYRGIYRTSKLEYEFNGHLNLADSPPYGSVG
jgi:GNAT superfamily N-acetyltransferase